MDNIDRYITVCASRLHLSDGYIKRYLSDAESDVEALEKLKTLFGESVDDFLSMDWQTMSHDDREIRSLLLFRSNFKNRKGEITRGRQSEKDSCF